MSPQERVIERIKGFDPKSVSEHEANFLVSLAQGNEDLAFNHYSKKLQTLYQLSEQSSIQISELLKEALKENGPDIRQEKLRSYYMRLHFDTGLEFGFTETANSANLKLVGNSNIQNTDNIDATTWVLGLNPEEISEGIEARNKAMDMVVELHSRLANTSATVYEDSGPQEYQNVGVVLNPTNGDLEQIRQQLEIYYKKVKSHLNQK